MLFFFATQVFDQGTLERNESQPGWAVQGTIVWRYGLGRIFGKMCVIRGEFARESRSVVDWVSHMRGKGQTGAFEKL